MTAEQIAELRGMVEGWWRHTREEVEALEAAIALAEQTCETCEHQYRRQRAWRGRPPIDMYCQKLSVWCEGAGNRCGAWRAKEKA